MLYGILTLFPRVECNVASNPLQIPIEIYSAKFELLVHWFHIPLV
jgi:hypothetical protein